MSLADKLLEQLREQRESQAGESQAALRRQAEIDAARLLGRPGGAS